MITHHKNPPGSDVGPSSPTRGPVGDHCDRASLGSTLARRSTDASLVEGVAAGHMSIVPEEDEECTSNVYFSIDMLS